MKLNLMAPINPLGYGVVGSNILQALVQLGHEVTLFPIGQVQPQTPQIAHVAKQAIARQPMFDYNAPCVKIWHQHDMAQRIGQGSMVGFPIFELDAFTDIEKNHLYSLDHIVVPSDWAADIVEQSVTQTNISVDVVPLGVDTSIFYPNYMEDNSKKCIFLNIGKWETRKGHDIIGKAFKEAFTETDEVELHMVCYNPFYSQEENKWWQNKVLEHMTLAMRQKVQFWGPAATQQEIAEHMQQATCGVFPARAEGWNLELLEMMACGKQVIATCYSGHTEFCTTENSMLILTYETEPAYGIQKDKQWFYGQGNWAKIGQKQKESLVLYMQQIYNAWKSGADMTNSQGLKTASEFSWVKSAQKLIEVVS